jgi:hypothetical protein
MRIPIQGKQDIWYIFLQQKFSEITLILLPHLVRLFVTDLFVVSNQLLILQV